MNIIQIGANKGCNSTFSGPDDFFTLIKDLKITNLILVEPLDIHLDSLKERYSWFKNTIIENVAISNKDSIKEMDFYYHIDDGPLYFVASNDPSHILGHNGYRKEGLIKKTVPCLSLNNLFDKYNLLEIDILCIDTEGLDGDIIKSINFNKYKIKEIYYEHIHEKFSISDFLKDNGYFVEPGECWSATKKAALDLKNKNE